LYFLSFFRVFFIKIWSIQLNFCYKMSFFNYYCPYQRKEKERCILWLVLLSRGIQNHFQVFFSHFHSDFHMRLYDQNTFVNEFIFGINQKIIQVDWIIISFSSWLYFRIIFRYIWFDVKNAYLCSYCLLNCELHSTYNLIKNISL
jgi:hypothetical protein